MNRAFIVYVQVYALSNYMAHALYNYYTFPMTISSEGNADTLALTQYSLQDDNNNNTAPNTSKTCKSMYL